MQNNIGIFFFFLIIVVIVAFLIWFFVFKVKHLKPNDLYMIDGGVKTGKSLISVMLSVKAYKKAIIKYHVGNFFIRVLNVFRKNKKAFLERPMLYSNMPLYKVKYNPLTIDIIMGKYRIPHGSVILCDEATLLADSMLGMLNGKDKKERFDEINENLTLFLKTYGHMTHGGKFFYNSQQVIDLHFAFKRNTSIYLWVARTRKYPFFCLSEVREVIHDESGDVVNIVDKDVEIDDRPLFVSKKWFKYYDRYYLDVLTRELPVLVNYEVEKADKRLTHIDIQEIVTLGTYKRIQEYNAKHKVPVLEVKKEVKENEKA